MLKFTRYISTNGRILNRGGPLIDHMVLDQLRDSSKLNGPSDILILDPQTINRQRKNNVSNQRQMPPPISQMVPNIFDDESPDQDSSSYIKLINNLRIHRSRISDNKYKSMASVLADSFTVPQLRNYIKQYYDSKEFSGTRHGISRKTKPQLCKIIIEDLWNIKRSGVKTSVEDLLVSNEINLKKKDLFLLLFKDGLLIKYLSRTGCDISFDSGNDTIRFTGTESQLNSANIILDSIIVNSYQQEVDLSTIKPLFEQKFHEFDVSELSKLLQVHIEPVSDSVYRFTSFNENQHKRAQRLLLWYLDYNKHAKQYIKVPEYFDGIPKHFLPFKDDESLSWNERMKNLFRLSTGTEKSTSSLIEKQLESFSDEKLLNKKIDTGEIDELRSFLTPPTIHQQSNVLTNTTDTDIVSEEEKQEIFDNLTNFKVSSTSVEESKISPPVFTATLGNILFEKDSDNSVIPIHEEHNNLPDSYVFSSNTSLINDQILNLPYFHQPNLTVKDVNNFRMLDPHEYTVQFRFQPSLLENQSVDLPPVEVWVDVKKFGNVDLTTLRLLTVENENKYYLSLPSKRSDLKVSSQVVGDLFGNGVDEEAETETETSIQSLLNSTTQKYARFKEQPGLEEFLKKSKLDFSGKTKPQVHPKLELNINGTNVVYQYISMNYRRQLEFVYKERLLQFSVIEGGSLGGRKSEVVIVGNQFDKTDLSQLIDDSITLIDQL